MRNLLYSFLVLLMLGSTACETTLEIELPEYSPQLVVHHYWNNNSDKVIVTVTQSVGLLENNNFENVEGATINLFENNELLYSFESGNFPNSTVPPIPGNQYRLTVSHPNFEDVEAVQTMPEPVDVLSQRLKIVEQPGDFGENIMEIRLEMEPTDERKYFEIGLFVSPKGSNNSWSLYPTEEQINGSINYNDLLLVTNASITESNRTLLARFYENNFNEEEYDYYLIFRTVSEERYLYQRAVTAQNNAEDNPFSEPVSIFSNINNGLGIFGLGYEERFDLIPE
ncbi:MAG: DUF4249 domain-containing protein [Saprospiraceae bacterium]|nr:DUF4249 domain-containing protein [Saprospiraceae bacterium]